MKEVLVQELEDLQLFADPFEEFQKSLTTSAWTATFVRKGAEIAIRREAGGAIRVLRGPGQRHYRSLKGLLVSETFADLGRLASAQMHVTSDLTDPTTGKPREYLPNAGQIQCGTETADLTFDRVCERLEEVVDRLRVFVVNGVAGVGKSHLIDRIVRRRAAPTSYKSGAPLLLHVESRGKVLTSLSDRIAGTLAGLRASFVEEELRPLIRRGAMQVAIDGFDELSDSRGYVRAWGALRDFIRDLRGKGTCILAGRDTMLDVDTVREGLGNVVEDRAVTFLHVQHPRTEDIRTWLSQRELWRGRNQDLALVEDQMRETEYFRRPFFVSQIADLGPDRFQDARGEPVVDLMDRIIRREGEKLTGVASDIEAEVASELYRRVLSEAAQVMVDDETNTIEVDLIALLIEDAFSSQADREMTSALVQRAGALALLEEDASDSNRRSFPHETVRSYFFSHNVFDDFSEHGPSVGLYRTPLSAEDFRIFNRVARSKTVDEQRRLRESLLAALRDANGHDYLRANVGGLLLAFAPLAGEEGEKLVLTDLELNDAWLADLAGTQQLVLIRCTIHRLDVRGADLGAVDFFDVRIYELSGDSFVRFGVHVPRVDAIIESKHLKESRWFGRPSEWIEKRSAGRSRRDPDERWYLLEKFARVSMRQYAIRSGKENSDPAARTILESPWWPDLRQVLEAHGRLEIREDPNASGPKSMWFHLVAGAEFLNPGEARQESTREILEEVNVATGG